MERCGNLKVPITKHLPRVAAPLCTILNSPEFEIDPALLVGNCRRGNLPDVCYALPTGRFSRMSTAAAFPGSARLAHPVVGRRAGRRFRGAKYQATHSPALAAAAERPLPLA